MPSPGREARTSVTADPRGAGPEAVRVLMVCTGNICRSPAAQLLLGSSLADASDITVASAGTMALVGEPVSAPIGNLLLGRGVDPGAFRARLLTERHVRGASLVLGMTRAHRGQAVSLWPAAVRHSFTLKEFARLATQVPEADLLAAGASSPAARLAALTRLAVRLRSPVPEIDDDVEDPYRRGDEVNELVFDEIERAVATITALTLGR